jgi:CubicO group peptidase (beta-lactamase class C family)
MKVNAQEFRVHDARSYKSGFVAALTAFAMTAEICDGASPTQDATPLTWPTHEWQVSTPEAEGMDSKELAQLVGWGTFCSFDSLLVVRHGKIIAEAYYAPYAAGIPHAQYSVTKSVIGTLTAIALKEGLLDSPSHPVLDFFDRHRIANVDQRKEAITVQHLLDMTSGLEWKQSTISFESNIEMERSPNWVQYILDRPMASVPGVTFNYSDANAHLLSAIITKLTGMSALEYGKAKLFGPLGINELYWRQDPQGVSNGAFGLSLLPRDMAKVGYLYLHNGAWEGLQLLPAAWIDKIIHATVNPNTGMGFWYSNFFWALPDMHAYMAIGLYGQVIIIFPDLDIVAVTTGRDFYDEKEFASLISHAVKSDTSLPADTTGAKLLANKILEVSTEKPTAVGSASKMAASISGKVYRFPPNPLNIKSVSLRLTDPQPRYNIEYYAIDTTKPASRFAGPIGLDGQYQKGEPTFIQWLGIRGINAIKGSWQADHTFVMNWLILGQGPAHRNTFTFDGDKLNWRVAFPDGSEISIDGKTGG